jgi:hypothetical protein
MSRTYGRGHDMNIDGNERMNIRCERESCLILCEMPSLSLSIRDFWSFCFGPDEYQLLLRVGLCVSLVLVSNPSQANTFLVLNVNRFISSHQSNVSTWDGGIWPLVTSILIIPINRYTYILNHSIMPRSAIHGVCCWYRAVNWNNKETGEQGCRVCSFQR